MAFVIYGVGLVFPIAPKLIQKEAGKGFLGLHRVCYWQGSAL